MGIFDDKVYESLDWISQAIEPIESPINTILTSIPDEFEIDYTTFLKLKNSHDNSLRKETIIKSLIDSERTLTWDEMNIIRDCFTVQVSENTVIDMESKTIKGNIKFLKIKNLLDDTVLRKILGTNGIKDLASDIKYNNVDISKINEILDILGKCDHIKSKSTRKKVCCLLSRLEKIMSNNEWNIKDTELANKVGLWILNYINHGNLAALGNLAKLKVMTHKGLPIYSIEEIK